ncbi:rRNA adenine N-6-methyltransferase family protein [Actinomycetaceae bacterium MB13-C1-2]|nr:rRNA adenine N-6-methyltransferase family protein [Actinomycetaceae bacterium MB13-C1-2]
MSQRLREAFKAAPRERFLPGDQKSSASLDIPLPIGFGVTCSQPTTVANMLSLLEVQPGQDVLDVGSGSGWTTALLAHLVGEEGSVTGVERISELVARSSRALSDVPNATIEQATDGIFGWPQNSPYDRILVSAMADAVPTDLVDQLTLDGVMVVPVSGLMCKVVKSVDGSSEVSTHGWYSFVPLIP